VNDTFVRLSGYAMEEVIGRSAAELGIWASPQDRAHIVQALQHRRHITKRSACLTRQALEQLFRGETE